MAETRTYQGFVYTRSAPGDPWTLQGPAQPQAQPQANSNVIPASPQALADRQRDMGRQNASDAREQTRITMAQEADERTASNQRSDEASRLRKDFASTAQAKEYQTVIRQYNAALKTQATPTGDQALITAYAKMLDPTSVVREQEFNTVASADSAIGKMVAKLNKELGVDESGLIRPEIRARVRREMLNLTKGYNQAYNQQRQFYTDLAQRAGIDPEEVVGPHFGEPFLPQIQSALERERRQASTNPVVQSDPRGELQPDGTFVKDNGVYDREGNYLGLQTTVTDDSPGGAPPAGDAPPSDPNGGYADSVLGQTMYGLNEGLAGTLGLPFDGLGMAMNLVPLGLNAVANTNLPTIQDPVLGGDWWKDRFTDIGAIGPQSNDPMNQFARRTAQSLGAAALPIAGVAGAGGKVGQALLSSLLGGAGAATAQQVAPGNPYAEFGGELLGSLAGSAGMVASGRRAAQREIEAAVPTVDQLKAQAGDLYRQAEQNGVAAGPVETQLLAEAVRKTLRDEGQLGPAGRVTNADTSTNKALNLIEQYEGLPMRPKEMDAVRRVVAEGRSSLSPGDQRMAQILTGQFDDWVRPMAPGFEEARGISSRYLQAQTLEKARESAGTRPTANALRNEYANLERKDIRGTESFSPEVSAAIDNVVKGTPYSRELDRLGKAAPTGIVSGGISAGVPFSVGTAIGGPGLGAALGATSLTVGSVARALSNANVGRRATIAELIARNGGALDQAPAIDPETQKVIAALVAGQGSQYANQ